MWLAQTAGAPWGATAAEWLHFAKVLELEADLLPVVSNPNGVVSPMSKLKGLGKTPSKYNQAREVVGIAAWTTHQATDRNVGQWLANSDYGICVQTRVWRALDIDIADPVVSRQVVELVELLQGVMPVRRRSGTGKCLLAMRMPGEFSKRVIQTPHGAIEFLATGQQFIAVGAHHAAGGPTGTRYTWVDSDGGVGLPGPAPDVTPAEFEVLWQALTDAFAIPGGESRGRAGMAVAKPRDRGDLRDPVVGFLDENGWVVEHERDGKVHVRCPWEANHTSDSSASASTWFPAGVGGFAQGHYRCLHAHCIGQTDGDFLIAVGYADADFTVVDVTTAGAALDTAAGEGAVSLPLPPFVRDRRGAPLATINNVLAALRRPDVCGSQIGYDEFRDALVVGRSGAWRPVVDNTYTELRSTLEGKGFLPVGKDMMRDAFLMVAAANRFDSAQQWARGLQWDGVPRAELFWVDYFGVRDTPYARAVGLYTWTALAGRAVQPGVKVDMVPVLIGLQGEGKTTAVESLSPIEDAFVEIDLGRKDDDIARSLRGKLVGEIAELRGLQSRDAEGIKAWVSRRHEEWVPKYQEFATRFARRLLLIGTGNEHEFLDDPTGERRWLPMEVGLVDVAGVRAVRDQLWAEGVALFDAGGVQWRAAQTLAVAEHAAFKVADVWLGPVSAWLARDAMDGEVATHQRGAARGDQPVVLVDALISCLRFDLQKITRKEQTRMGGVLRALGYVKKDIRVDGQVLKRWLKDERAKNSAFDDLA